MSKSLLQSDGTKIGIVDGDGEAVISLAEFCAWFNVDGWVRMHPTDFAAAAELDGRFTHFNLTSTMTGGNGPVLCGIE